jgi:hypothetical protein
MLYNTGGPKVVRRSCPANTLNAQASDQAQFPKEGSPHWDPNNDWDYQQLERYQEALLRGVKERGKKAMNMSKISEVLQRLDESLTYFYEHLC